MKIVNTSTGIPYQLNPGTQIEVERTNLFFNEYGEQTFPVDLPDTDVNRKNLGYPDMLANRFKVPTGITATLQDDSYFMSCRQAVLGAQRKENISTSFYMNEGSFLSRISKVSLSEVFGNETIAGITTVQQGIDFCKSLMNNANDKFAIFPVIVDLDGERRICNRFNFMDSSGKVVPDRSGALGLYNQFPRSETVNDNSIKLDPGYYITPFIRGSYLLRRILSYFGYTLQDNFFERTDPFRTMVFVNNTIDSLVNGSILLTHLIPDCMCSTILEVYRKKFCCEFIPDEVNKTVSIELFNDVVSSDPDYDLSSCLTSHPAIEYGEFQQIKLSSEEVIQEGESFDSTFELAAKYPEAFYNPDDNSYYRWGYKDTTRTKEKVADGNIPYYAGGTLKTKEITCPDCVYTSVYYEYSDVSYVIGSRENPTRGIIAPYIGDGRALNSTLNVSTSASDDDSTPVDKEKASGAELKPILSLVAFRAGGYSEGVNHTDGQWNYSLLYNGPCGIFERFYRTYDNMLRNSFIPVKVDLLLSPEQKMNLNAHRKKLLHGQQLLVNKLKYNLGGKNEPVESEFLTTYLYEPVSVAIAESERLKENQTYKWKIVRDVTEVTEEVYNNSPVKVDGSITRTPSPLPAIYPAPPTEAQYNAGGNYFHREYCFYYTSRLTGKKVYEKVDWWLTPVLYTAADTDYSRPPGGKPRE